jgi:hemoglobin-like flavoprotein
MDLLAVKTSFGRCLQNNQFLWRFYEIFIASHESIPPKFADTSFSQQIHLLRQGLNMLILHADNQAASRATLDRLRLTHSKHHLDIHPDLYPYWIDSLIKAIYEADTQMDKNLENQWRQVLSFGIQYIAGGYDQDFMSY